MNPTKRRPPALRRSWLFVAGADARQHHQAPISGADVVILELEDSTAPAQRPAARSLAAAAFTGWRAAGALAAVRINPLESDGIADLASIVPARPDIILMSKVSDPAQVQALAAEVTRLEQQHGLPRGGIELVPNIESARGVMLTYAIATASERVTAVAGSTEDTAADLGAVRSKDGIELAYARQRLHLECCAAKVVSVDCPYTYADTSGCRADTMYARRLGYSAKLINHPEHVAAVNDALTPSEAELAEARAIISAFDVEHRGLATNQVGGRMLELPIYLNAQRLLARAEALNAAAAAG